MGTRAAFGSIAINAAFTEKSPTLTFAALESHKLGGKHLQNLFAALVSEYDVHIFILARTPSHRPNCSSQRCKLSGPKGGFC